MNKLTLVFKKKRGPATEEGKRRIGDSRLKTGTRSNQAMRDRRVKHDLIASSKSFLEEVQMKLEARS